MAVSSAPAEFWEGYRHGGPRGRCAVAGTDMVPLGAMKFTNQTPRWTLSETRWTFVTALGGHGARRRGRRYRVAWIAVTIFTWSQLRNDRHVRRSGGMPNIRHAVAARRRIGQVAAIATLALAATPALSLAARMHRAPARRSAQGHFVGSDGGRDDVGVPGTRRQGQDPDHAHEAVSAVCPSAGERSSLGSPPGEVPSARVRSRRRVDLDPHHPVIDSARHVYDRRVGQRQHARPLSAGPPRGVRVAVLSANPPTAHLRRRPAASRDTLRRGPMTGSAATAAPVPPRRWSGRGSPLPRVTAAPPTPRRSTTVKE